MNSNNQHIENENSLQQAFQDWDAGLPSYELWENLEAELSTSAVWNNLNEVLEEDHNTTDDNVFNAYEKWSPNVAFNGWTKLQEELSRERVWIRINHSLNQFSHQSSLSFLKVAASLLLFVTLAFYTNFEGSLFVRTKFPTNNSSRIETSENLKEKQVEVFANVPVLENKNNSIEEQDKTDILLTNDKYSAVHTEIETAKRNEYSNSSTEIEDLAGLEKIPAELGYAKSITDFVIIPFKSQEIRPKFSIAFGGQFSILNEKNLRQYSSLTPNMGITADFQYHTYLRNIRFTQDIGFSQYAQNKGNYNNGRYITSIQKLNTLYLSSSIGYTHKNFTVYGGVSINRLINGYEQNKHYISNVYTAKKMQVGGILGMDYHISPFRNKTAMGIGLQYQLVSQIKGENTTFNNLQGLKLQIKYSF